MHAFGGTWPGPPAFAGVGGGEMGPPGGFGVGPGLRGKGPRGRGRMGPPGFGGPWGPGFARMGRHGRHGPGGRGPGFGPGGWPGGWRGMGFGPGRRGRARRGDVRAAALLLLAEEPRNGYGLMEEIERRSEGAWRPSPGAMYPALAQLEDEGLVRAEEAARGRSFRLTEEGEAYVEEHRDQLGTPWQDAGEGVPDALLELRHLIGQLGMTTMQVAQSGNETQIAEAKKVLDEARRSLYRILAD
jgi:DNA-binding PadR family transcriptional regulator